MYVRIGKDGATASSKVWIALFALGLDPARNPFATCPRTKHRRASLSESKGTSEMSKKRKNKRGKPRLKTRPGVDSITPSPSAPKDTSATWNAGAKKDAGDFRTQLEKGAAFAKKMDGQPYYGSRQMKDSTEEDLRQYLLSIGVKPMKKKRSDGSDPNVYEVAIETMRAMTRAYQSLSAVVEVMTNGVSGEGSGTQDSLVQQDDRR